MTGPEAAGAPRSETDPWALPRIYAASLTDYNAGVLHGQWINADAGVEAVQAAIDEMLTESPTARRYGEPAEEWAIHDFSGFGPLHLHELEPLERVCLLAEGLVSHGDAFGAWMADREPSELPSPEDFEDHFLGEWPSPIEWGESLLDDLGISLDALSVPDSLRPYLKIDVDSWVHDMQLGGEISVTETSSGNVYVFWND